MNPYELARLARNLDTTTTDVIARFTVDGGTALATRPDTACVFLGPGGCTVHADRPLVCRLYPLGRIVNADGSERFVENEPHPETAGVYGDDGTVGAFVDAQGVAPYVAAADRYFAVLARMMTRDASDKHATPVDGSSLPDAVGLAATTDIDVRWFIDADLAVRTDAERDGTSEPAGVDALVERHLGIIGRWADQLARRDGLVDRATPAGKPGDA